MLKEKNTTAEGSSTSRCWSHSVQDRSSSSIVDGGKNIDWRVQDIYNPSSLTAKGFSFQAVNSLHRSNSI